MVSAPITDPAVAHDVGGSSPGKDVLVHIVTKFTILFLLICTAIGSKNLQAQANNGILHYQHDWSVRSRLTDDWQAQHPVQSGWHLFSVSVFDSMHAWASGWHDSAAGLVVMTTDGGETWNEATRTLPFYINDICFVTTTLGWVVGGSNALGQPGYVRCTTDRGQTWTVQLTTPNSVFHSVFFLDTVRGWVGSDSGMILSTTNAGATWQEQARGRNMSVNDISFLPNGIGWAGGGYGPATAFLRTSNYGAQWDSISDIRVDRFSFLDDSSGWAITTHGTYAGFNRKTFDGGRTWSEGLRITDVFPTDVAMMSDSLVLSSMWDSRVDPPLSYYPISMRNLTKPLPPIETRVRILWGIGFAGTGYGFAVGYDEIVSSRDSGRTWTNQRGPQSSYLLSLDMVDDSVGWVVGEKQLIMRTTDGGNNWKAQTPALAGDLFSLSAIDRSHAFAAGSVFMSTTDGGVTWLKAATPGNYTITSLKFLDTRTGWAATNSYNVLHTTNGGVTWSQQAVSAQRLYAIDFVDSNYGWCAGESGIIYGTTNGGIIWNTQALGAGHIFSSIDFVDRDHGWVVGRDLILRTTNGGMNWITSDSSILASYRAVHFVNRDTGWAVGGQGRIIATTDGGVTWIVQRPGGGPRDLGLYSIDAVSTNLAWISGDLGEILHTRTGGGITSVQTVQAEVPLHLQLDQNYPNPFNPTTTIRFAVPSSGLVSLHVYDILGRDVAVLVDKYLPAGTFETSFNASQLTSGVYFCKIVLNGTSTFRKMLFLK